MACYVGIGTDNINILNIMYLTKSPVPMGGQTLYQPSNNATSKNISPMAKTWLNLKSWDQALLSTCLIFDMGPYTFWIIAFYHMFIKSQNTKLA